MKLMVFGGTGRTGSCFIDQAIARGHEVTAYVRDKNKVKNAGAKWVMGDVRNPEAVAQSLNGNFDAVIVCIGNTVLEPSTIVTEGYRSIIASMKKNKLERLLGVSGSAEMPDKTFWGALSTRLFKLTPVGHAMRDHDAAYSEVASSGLKWTLAGCNYLPDGPSKGSYKKELRFPGGFKIIHPPDVADFLLRAAEEGNYTNQIIGIWY
jgi:putative NADH-flavin reductase